MDINYDDGDYNIDHLILEELKNYSEFYDSLSFSVGGFITSGVLRFPHAISNIDVYIFDSINNTLDSIRMLLNEGRLNDSYALLRLIYELIVADVYVALYSEKNCSVDSYVVETVNGWVNGKIKLPKFDKMVAYIKSSDLLSGVNKLLLKDDRYQMIKVRCNDHVHFNDYRHLLMNKNTLQMLDVDKIYGIFLRDLRDLIIMHLAYVFTIKPYYMSSDDYVNALDFGLEPQEGAQYFVASFIQKIFDDLIKVDRIDIFSEIKTNTYMDLK